MRDANIGANTLIGEGVTLGEGVTIGCNCVIEDGVELDDGCYVDHGAVIRRGTRLGARAYVGSNCVLGEHQVDFCRDRKRVAHELTIGSDAIIRSGTVVYTGSRIGDWFDTGHHATVREDARIGDHVMFGTLADVQGDCSIGSYVRAHSNAHIGRKTVIDSFVWVFPYVLFTNDPTPPSEVLLGSHVRPFAVVASRAVILPGVEIGQDALVAAGAQVARDVAPYEVVSGAPARRVAEVRMLNIASGRDVYPWREHFERGLPWAGSDFEAWFAGLADADVERYGLQDLE